jgi:hypothetical protein
MGSAGTSISIPTTSEYMMRIMESHFHHAIPKRAILLFT